MEEEAVGGGDDLSEFQDEGPDAKYFRCMYELSQQKKMTFYQFVEVDDVEEDDFVAGKEAAEGDTNDKDKTQDE